MLPNTTAKRSLAPARQYEPRPFVPFFGDDGEKCGHLFAAIVTQAYHDAFSPQIFNSGEKAVVQRDSISFLTAKSGEWRAHRNWVCTCAGIDGDALAQGVRDMLSGATSPPTKDKKVSIAQFVLAFKPEKIEQARAIYAEMNNRTPAPRPVRKQKSTPKPVAEPKPARVIDETDSDVMKDWLANMSAA